MKKIFIPLLTVVVLVSIILAGCVPGAAPAPVTPPPVTPPVEPVTPPVTPPPAIENPLEGLGLKPDGTPYYFAYVPWTNDAPFALFNMDTFKDLGRRCGARVEVYPIPYESTAQVAACEDILTMRPDALQYHPITEDALTPVFDRYFAAGIPVFQEDHPAAYNNTGVVGIAMFSGPLMGGTGAAYAVEKAKELGIHLNVLIVNSSFFSTPGVERPDGFKAVARENPEWIEVTLETVECNWMEAPAADAIIDMIPAHPEINCIYEPGSMGGGVIEGLRAIGELYPVGHQDHIMLIQNDDGPRALEGVEEYWADGVVEHSPRKETTLNFLQLLTYVSLGQPLDPMTISIQPLMITTDTIGTRDWDMSWGNLIRNEVDLKDLPVESWGFITIPTKAMRMELRGY